MQHDNTAAQPAQDAAPAVQQVPAEQHQRQQPSANTKTAVRAALQQNNPGAKPRWRGVLHSYACAAMLSAGAILVLEAQTSLARMSALVYVTAAAFQFFISAVYHTNHWGPGMHKLLQRIDHSAIYGLIAATYTPMVAVPLVHDPIVARRLLVRVWMTALSGAAKTWLWPNSPRFLSALTYVAMGWSALPYLPMLTAAVDSHVVMLVAAGGVLYTLGAIVYALRYPDPWPLSFGFHEVFHTLVVAASVCHFAACYHVLVKADNSAMGAAASAAAGLAGAAGQAACTDALCWQRMVITGC